MTVPLELRGYPIRVPLIEVQRGDPKGIILCATAPPSPGTLSAPVDLGGFGSTWVASARLTHRSSTHFDFVIDQSNISDPDDPRLILRLSDVVTASMPGDRYHYAVRATGGAAPITVWMGTLAMIGDFNA